jgi:hypothetical protein
MGRCLHGMVGRFCAICTNTLHEVPESKPLGRPPAEKQAPILDPVSPIGGQDLAFASRGVGGVRSYRPKSNWAFEQMMKSLSLK